MDRTLDPDLRSWVPSANDGQTDFPVQNLPFGAFRRAAGAAPSLGIAIGDRVLDLRAAGQGGAFDTLPDAVREALAESTLNRLMGLGSAVRRQVRDLVSNLLAERSEPTIRYPEAWLPAQADTQAVLPMRVGDYTDFYASLHHATRVGRMFRPDNPLLANYKYVPIGYHGRSSSLVVSDTPIARPSGQLKSDDNESPVLAASRLLDYECEVGLVIGEGNPLGEPIPITGAEEHLFGFCLVNDWSARDIQRWEYQPLGPFLAKSFATTVSPWIVTIDALAPFRAALADRASGDPPPLPYLTGPGSSMGIDLRLEVHLRTRAMREAGLAQHRVSQASFLDMYWSPAQMVTHHASNGCNLQPGDLLASGTVSGPDDASSGCLLELTARGTKPIRLPSGEERRFLEDGDEVTMTGRCAQDGFVPIGFGTCRGTVHG